MPKLSEIKVLLLDGLSPISVQTILIFSKNLTRLFLFNESCTLPEPAKAKHVWRLSPNPKRFHLADFDLNRVLKHLAGGTWQRTISSQGATNMFGQKYQVGYPFRGLDITVYFDPENTHWVFKDKRGKIIKSLPATNLTEIHIRSLS